MVFRFPNVKLSNQVGDINKESLPGPEALQKPGTKDGQVSTLHPVLLMAIS